MKKTSYSLAGIASLLFLLLAVLIKTEHTHSPSAFDQSLQNFAYGLQSNAGLVKFFSDFTNIFGDKGGFITAAVVVLVLFFLLKERLGAIWFGLLTIVSTLVNTVVKDLVGRVRPDSHRIAAFAHEAGQSFASGHSLFATILFGSLFLIFVVKMKSAGMKSLFAVLALLLTLLVMFSRIFVGVHYPTDTLGGLLEGLAFLGFSYPYFAKKHKVLKS